VKLVFLSDSQEGETFLFKSISCEGAFFLSSAFPIGFRLFFVRKKASPSNDYGKEFQQKIRGASVRTFS
jgi:hypothetical protein